MLASRLRGRSRKRNRSSAVAGSRIDAMLASRLRGRSRGWSASCSAGVYPQPCRRTDFRLGHAAEQAGAWLGRRLRGRLGCGMGVRNRVRLGQGPANPGAGIAVHQINAFRSGLGCLYLVGFGTRRIVGQSEHQAHSQQRHRQQNRRPAEPPRARLVVPCLLARHGGPLRKVGIST